MIGTNFPNLIIRKAYVSALSVMSTWPGKRVVQYYRLLMIIIIWDQKNAVHLVLAEHIKPHMCNQRHQSHKRLAATRQCTSMNIIIVIMNIIIIRSTLVECLSMLKVKLQA